MELRRLIKTNIDLQNVDNTSDANKPISTATQTAKCKLTDPSTTRGDIITRGAANALKRLPVGALDHLLSVDSNGDLVWREVRPRTRIEEGLRGQLISLVSLSDPVY